jgi:hypothetical protein
MGILFQGIFHLSLFEIFQFLLSRISCKKGMEFFSLNFENLLADLNSKTI